MTEAVDHLQRVTRHAFAGVDYLASARRDAGEGSRFADLPENVIRSYNDHFGQAMQAGVRATQKMQGVEDEGLVTSYTTWMGNFQF